MTTTPPQNKAIAIPPVILNFFMIVDNLFFKATIAQPFNHLEAS